MTSRLEALTRNHVSRFAASVLLVAAAGAVSVAQAQPVPPAGPAEGRGSMEHHHRMGPHGGHGDHGGGMGAGVGMGMGWMSGRGLDRMLDSVKASDAQRSRIRQIAEAARTELSAQRDAGRALRDRAMAAFTQPTVDAREVESVRQAMLAQHDARSRRMSQAMLEVAQVLTPEQRSQLGQQMKARSERWQQRQGQANPQS